MADTRRFSGPNWSPRLSSHTRLRARRGRAVCSAKGSTLARIGFSSTVTAISCAPLVSRWIYWHIVLWPSVPVSVAPVPAEHASVAITMSNGTLFQLDALGAIPKTFQVGLWGTDRRSTHEITDNFTAFRRTLWHFIEMVRTGTPAIEPAETLRLMQVLRAERRALQERRPVSLDDIEDDIEAA